MEIHSRKMTVAPGVNFEELARSTDEFNGAQLKAVCVEAGMIALREGATKLNHEHYLSGIAEGSFSSFSLLSFHIHPHTVDSAEQEEEHAHVFRLIWAPISRPCTCYPIVPHCFQSAACLKRSPCATRQGLEEG